MAERAAGELDVDEPAVSAEALVQPGIDADDLASQITRRIDEVAAMREHVIAPEIGLRIAGWLPDRGVVTISGWTASVIA